MVGIKLDRPDPNRRLKYLMNLALFAALSYLVNRWFIIPRESSPEFFHEYFSDALALPVYIPLSLFAAVKLDLISQEFRIRSFHMLGIVIIFSLLFEGLVPVLNKASTRDLWDVAAYLTGGILVLLVSKLAEILDRYHSMP